MLYLPLCLMFVFYILLPCIPFFSLYYKKKEDTDQIRTDNKQTSLTTTTIYKEKTPNKRQKKKPHTNTTYPIWNVKKNINFLIEWICTKICSSQPHWFISSRLFPILFVIIRLRFKLRKKDLYRKCLLVLEFYREYLWSFSQHTQSP